MFKSGSPVKGEEFIDRKEHLPIFKAYLDNNQHIMIKAPRRFGKTSLIKHIFDHQKNYEFIYIDIRLHHTLETLSKQILNKAYEFVKIQNFIQKSKESLFDLLQSIKSIAIPEVAEVSIDFVNKPIEPIEFFIHSLDTVNKIAIAKNINIKVIFDEFQDIVNLYDKNILEVLRSVAQHHENITYIFLGSIESIMTNIFESKSSPFFHFASVMQLEGLDTEELHGYTIKQFDSKNLKYDKDMLKKLIIFLQGHPEYSAKVLQTLYINATLNNNIITNEAYYDALSYRILENRIYFDEIIIKLKSKKHHFEIVYNIANKIKHTQNSATVYNTHMSLENMGIIKRIKKGKYEIVDIFFKIFLQQDNDTMIAFEDKIKSLNIDAHDDLYKDN